MAKRKSKNVAETVSQLCLTERPWKDEDVNNYFMHSFECVPIEKAPELCKKWWLAYRGASTENVFHLCVCMSLHLVDPLTKRYAVRFGPTIPRNLTPNPELSSLLDFPYRKSDDDPRTKDKKFNHWYKNLPPVNKVAFTAYLAACLLRVKVKDSEAVCSYISTSMMTDYVKIYHLYPNDLSVPLPYTRFLGFVSDPVKTKTNEGVQMGNMVFSRYLSIYQAVKHDSKLGRIGYLLEKAILTRTSGNGMHLVTMATDAAKILNVEIEVMFDFIRQRTPSPNDKRSLDLLSTFINTVGKTDLWLWCRVLDYNYHNTLGVRANSFVATVLAGVMGPTGDEPIWKFQGLAEKPEVKDGALSVSKALCQQFGSK